MHTDTAPRGSEIVYAPGSRVRITLPDLGDGDPDPIAATVLAVCLRGETTYEVAWWNERSRHTAWVTAREVVHHESEPLRSMLIGFHSLP